MYDRLERIKSIKEIQLAHSHRTPAIASAQVKAESIETCGLVFENISHNHQYSFGFIHSNTSK